MEEQQKRADSLYHTVRELLLIRKAQEAFAKHDNLKILYAEEGRRAFAYERDDLLMLCNPSGREEKIPVEVENTDVIYRIGSMRTEEGGCVLEPQSFAICRK